VGVSPFSPISWNDMRRFTLGGLEAVSGLNEERTHLDTSGDIVELIKCNGMIEAGRGDEVIPSTQTRTDAFQEFLRKSY